MRFIDKRTNEIKYAYSIITENIVAQIRFTPLGKTYRYKLSDIQILEEDDKDISIYEVPFKIYMFERACYNCSKKTKIITYIRYADTNEDVTFPWNINRLARGQRIFEHLNDPSIEYYDIKVIGDIDIYDEMLFHLYPDRIQLRYSKTLGCVYLMNLCEHCGAKQGNHFVYREINKIINENRIIKILNGQK